MNRTKYYLYQFLKDFMPIYSMMLILFENDGMDILQTSLLLTIWCIPVVILEIPSGILADRWSRKGMVIVGSILISLCFAVWLIGGSFFVYAFGFVLWGIGLAFRSGAEEALIFDSMKKDGEEAGFDKVLGRGKFLSGIGITTASLLSGFITTNMGMEWTLILSVVAGLLSILAIASFHEVNLFRNNQSSNQKSIREDSHEQTSSSEVNGKSPLPEKYRFTSMLKDALLFFRNKKSLLILVIASITVVGTAGVLEEFDSLIAKGFGLSLEAVGIWISMKYIIVAVGSLIGPYMKQMVVKVVHIKKTLYIISFFCVIGSVFLGLTGCISKMWVMGLYAVYYLIMSGCEVIAEDYLQQQIEEEGRSTIHSIISMAYNLFGILFYAVLGFVFRVGDLFNGLMVVAAYIVLVTMILCLIENFRRKHTGNEKNICE